MRFHSNRNKELETLQAGIDEISGDLKLHETKCADCADKRPCGYGWALINERLIYLRLREFLSGGAN